MRPRVIAIIILVIFLIIPVIVYWYFYSSRVSSIIFVSESDTPYTITLEGSLQYRYFPLLDSAFSYESTCIKGCIFSPIPPLKYTLVISGSGKEDIRDTIDLLTGEEYKYSVDLVPSLRLIPSGITISSDTPSLSGSIGKSIEGKDISLGNLGFEGIGVYEVGRDTPLFSLNLPIKQGGLDKSGMYVVFEGIRPEQYIFSLDGMRKIIFPFRETILLVSYETTWKVLTTSGAYELRFDTWQKNPRFTDIIDISDRYRIGYISREDEGKLTLQNFPLGDSYFILLDRTTTESRIIKRGYDVEGFFYRQNIPSILQKDGTISEIAISLDE